MKRAEERYKDRGLSVVWIGFQDRPERIKKYAELRGLGRVGFDDGDKVSKAFGIKYGAGAAFVNSAGIVVSRIPKGFSSERMEAELNKILP